MPAVFAELLFKIISPTLSLVHPFFSLIVFWYPFLLFFFILVSTGLVVCSSTVKSQVTISLGIVGKLLASQSIDFLSSLPSAAGDLIAYSLQPTSRIRVRASFVPGLCSGFSLGRVRISRGWRRYVRACNRAKT